MALNIIFEKAQASLPAGETFEVATIAELPVESSSSMHVYAVHLAPHGYLLVTGDDRLPPVLAFSATSDLVWDELGPNAFRSLVKRHHAAAQQALAKSSWWRPFRGQTRNQREWSALTQAGEGLLGGAGTAGSPVTTASSVLVAPLVATHWSQWNHFNERFPADPQPGVGYDGRAPAGCMPVAGAQLAAFHAWPPYGIGGHVDIDNNVANLISGSFNGVFASPINWSAMHNTYNPWGEEPTGAVAAVSGLLYNFGVALDLDFGSYDYGGSTAAMQALARGLNRSFFYERGTYKVRSGREAAFDNDLRAELLAGHPVVCGIPGHAVIADGLSVDNGLDYFHLNYGFGGMNDGWYQASAIPEGSVESAILGQRPALIPLLTQPGFVTNVNGTLNLAWSTATARTPDVARFRVREGQFLPGSLVDSGADLQNWTDYSGGWVVANLGYQSSTCLRKSGEVGEYALTLRDVAIPSASSIVQGNYKAILLQDHVYFEISTDRGQTWQTLAHLTNTGYDTAWKPFAFSLASYAGREVEIRVLYVFKSGQYYGANGGIWIDNVSISNIQQMQWSVISDTIPASATNFAVGMRLSGTQHFEVQAFDGTAWSAAAPFTTITVALDPLLDVDGDGLANGWEQAQFGSATGGVAQADVDGDGASNFAEYVAGTDPHSAASRLALLTTDVSGKNPVVSWISVGGKSYTVWRAASLAEPFAPAVSNLAATPPVNTYTDAAVTNFGSVYYRVSVP